MPHNHSPRCCCEHTYNGAIVTSAIPCPICVEHGELATLGNNAPFINCPQCDARADGTPCTHRPPADAGHPADDDTDAWLAAQPAVLADQRARLAALECPSCHTTNGHPHTDYCQAPTSQPRCQTVDVDGEPVRVSGHISPAAGEAIAVVVRATRDAMAQPDTVDLVGHLRASVERAREARLARAQTSQPAATTSQPASHTRARGGPVDPPHTRHLTTFGSHPTTECRPLVCGRTPTE